MIPPGGNVGETLNEALFLLMCANFQRKGRADEVDHLVSKRLKMRRLMLGLSQHELGEAVDVSIQQIQKYEKATNRISSGKLYNLAKFLKVSVSYFFENSGTGEAVLANFCAEESTGYEHESKDSGAVTEKEMIGLVKAFSELKDSKLRKKVIDLVKSMS